MRKHDVRKWLHAILDLLPVMLIPVFMIYSHRHTLTERTDVDIQYKYQSNEVNSVDDLIQGNVYHAEYLNLGANEIYDNIGYENNIRVNILSFTSSDLNFNLEDYDEFFTNEYDARVFNSLSISYFVVEDSALCRIYFTNDNCYVSYDTSDDLIFNDVIFCCIDGITGLRLAITDMWDINDFSYTDYNVIESVDVQDTNSDIMSVFMDDFNNAIDKYFNMGNVFNLNGVYQWFNTNIFSGNAPTIIYSIWNIALYELVMDLLFLLYGLFMWFIDMVQHLMDKPFKSIK